MKPHAVALSIVCLFHSLSALELRRPKDLNYAFEIYDGATFVSAAASFKKLVKGVPFYRATTIHLQKPVQVPIILMVDKDTDEVIQHYTLSSPLHDTQIIELNTQTNELEKSEYHLSLTSAPSSPSSSSSDEGKKRSRLTDAEVGPLEALMLKIEALETNCH